MITKPLVSLADVMSNLPVRSGNATYDARITDLILVASSQIEAAVRRSFTEQEHTQYFRTVNTRSMRYDFGGATNESGLYEHARAVRYPLIGYPFQTSPAIQVFYDPYRVFDGNTLVESNRYVVRGDGTLILRMPTVEGEDFLKVVYTAGFTVGTDDVLVGVPADIRIACITQVMHLFSRLTPDNIGVDSERGSKSVAPAKLTKLGGLVPEAANMVMKYRTPLLGLG